MKADGHRCHSINFTLFDPHLGISFLVLLKPLPDASYPGECQKYSFLGATSVTRSSLTTGLRIVELQVYAIARHYGSTFKFKTARNDFTLTFSFKFFLEIDPCRIFLCVYNLM